MHTTVSCRIPEQLNAALQEAVDSEGVFQSELIRQALRHYIHENPDNLKALNEAATEISPRKVQLIPYRPNTEVNSVR